MQNNPLNMYSKIFQSESNNEYMNINISFMKYSSIRSPVFILGNINLNASQTKYQQRKLSGYNKHV